MLFFFHRWKLLLCMWKFEFSKLSILFLSWSPLPLGSWDAASFDNLINSIRFLFLAIYYERWSHCSCTSTDDVFINRFDCSLFMHLRKWYEHPCFISFSNTNFYIKFTCVLHFKNKFYIEWWGIHKFYSWMLNIMLKKLCFLKHFVLMDLSTRIWIDLHLIYTADIGGELKIK